MTIGVGCEGLDRDDRLGEAIEAYLALMELGTAPDTESFASQYPDLTDDLKDAIEGLSLVRGLVGEPSGSGERLQTGHRLAGYRITGELGSGGMGIVYEAVHVDLDRPVALKVLDARTMRPGSTGLQRFLNEAKMAASLHHTHIVPVFDVGHVGGLCYYAMQRIEGNGLDALLRTLRRDRSTAAGSESGPEASSELDESAVVYDSPADPLLVSNRPREVARREGVGPVARRHVQLVFEPPKGSSYFRWVAEVGREAADALAYAHTRGVIHRDVKPSNLLVDARGSSWVVDFGLARRATDPALTQGGRLLGTPRYMSPEQARSLPLDATTDVYSLGVTLYEMLSLRPPFDGRDSIELIEQICRREPLSPRRIDPRIPRDLETIVLKAMAKRSSDRYATAAELAEDLGRFLAFEPVLARRIGPVGRLWRLARRHPAVSLVSTAAVVAVMAVATLAYARVVMERDRALEAEAGLESALRENLLSQASLLRISAVPNRRTRGLALLEKAGAMDPPQDLLPRLRQEAVSFLELRDLNHLASVATERYTSLGIDETGSHLAVLGDEGRTLSLWDLEDDAPVASPRNLPAVPVDQMVDRGDRGRGVEGRFSAFAPSNRLAMAGPFAAVLWPNGQGIRLHHLGYVGRFEDIDLPGHDILALLGYVVSGRTRLVLIERLPGLEAPAPEGASEREHPRFRYRVSLLDTDDPEREIQTLASSSPESDSASPPLVAINPEGTMVAVGWMRQPGVSFYDGETGQLAGTLDSRTTVSTLAMGPHDMLAVASSGVVRLWESTTSTPLLSLTPNQGFIRNLRFSPDGALLAISGIGADVELWEPASSSLVALVPTKEFVTDVRFSAEGRMLVVGQPESLALWEIQEPEVVAHAGEFEEPVSALSFTGDGGLAIGFRGDAPLRLWNPDQSSAMARVMPDLVAAAVTRGTMGETLIMTPEGLAWLENGQDEPFRRLELPGPAMSMMQALAATPDGRTVVCTRGPQVFLWRSHAPNEVTELGAEESASRDRGQRPSRGGRPRTPWWSRIALTPHGDRVFLCSVFGDFRTWDLNTRRPSAFSAPGWPEKIYAVAISADGRMLALGGEAGMVTLCDATDGHVLDRLEPAVTPQDTQVVTALAFRPDGRRLAVGDRSGAIMVWNLETRVFARSLPLSGHRGIVIDLTYSPDGRLLASTGEDKHVAIWRMDRLVSRLTAMGLGWESATTDN